MPSPPRSQPEIADILALASALEGEAQRGSRERALRDKRFAASLETATGDRCGQALAWLDAVEADDEAVGRLHQQAETALHVTELGLVALAILLGVGATLGAFYFDGSGRVNAVSVLAVLVVLPGLFLIPFSFAALPERIAQRLPGVRLAALLSRGGGAGRLAPLLWRVFPRELRDSLALLSGRLTRHQSLYAGLQKGMILRWSQLFALSFQLTVLIACLVLVVFSDLAFGWSTTLTSGDAALDAYRVHRVTSAIAWPWSGVLPDARPSLALIGESRYFRVVADSLSLTQAARLGGWWQFVVLTIGVYGLLPRLITLGFARFRLRASSRAVVSASPGLSALLRRLHRARVESIAVEPEANEAAVKTERAQPSAMGGGHIQVVLNWSGVPLDHTEITQLFPQASIHAAGGTATLAADKTLVEQLGCGTGEPILILVKGWEPPLMEFMDFLASLRRALGQPPPIIVLPVGLDETTGELPPASVDQLKRWRNKVAEIGDPWLRVASNLEEVQS